MKMDSSKRLNYIDVAKGLAVLAVIFGHTFRQSMRTDFAWCDFSYLFVYKFHVSLLFVLSGMGYGLTGNKNLELGTAAYLKKKAKSLILPWFTGSAYSGTGRASRSKRLQLYIPRILRAGNAEER